MKTDQQLAEEIGEALEIVDRYPDPGTKAAAVLRAIPPARMIARRVRCCRFHKALGWLNVAQLFCMRQFFLRVSWRDEGIGAGTTIRMWAWLGNKVAHATLIVQRMMFRHLEKRGVPACHGTCDHRPHVENT